MPHMICHQLRRQWRPICNPDSGMNSFSAVNLQGEEAGRQAGGAGDHFPRCRGHRGSKGGHCFACFTTHHFRMDRSIGSEESNLLPVPFSRHQTCNSHRQTPDIPTYAVRLQTHTQLKPGVALYFLPSIWRGATCRMRTHSNGGQSSSWPNFKTLKAAPRLFASALKLATQINARTLQPPTLACSTAIKRCCLTSPCDNIEARRRSLEGRWPSTTCQ